MTDKTKKNKNTLLCTIFGYRGKDTGILLLRLFAGGMLLPHGIQKAENFTALSTSFADPIGIGPKLSLILIMLTEILGSILIITGFLTRFAALAAMFGMFVAAFMSSPGGFTMETGQVPLLYMGMFAVLFLTGAGRYSVDEPIRRRVCGVAPATRK